jgi:hypothetical protein
MSLQLLIKLSPGTADANLDIQHSGLDTPSRGWALENLKIYISRQISIGDSFLSGKKDRPTRVKRDHFDYVDRLQWISKKLIILHDVVDRRAFLVDGASVLLHLVRTSLHTERTGPFGHLIKFKPEQLKGAADARGGLAAISVLSNIENARLQIRENIDEQNPDKCHRFKDRVDRVWKILEQLIDYQEDLSYPDGKGFLVSSSPWDHLEGFDFLDVATEMSHFEARKLRLRKGAEGWVPLTRALNTVTLFGDGFGSILSPSDKTSTSCSTCYWNYDSPRGRDILAMSVSDLWRLAKDRGRVDDETWKIIDDFYWDSPSKSMRPCGLVCGLSRIQTFRRSSEEPNRSYNRKAETVAQISKSGGILLGSDVADAETDLSCVHPESGLLSATNADDSSSTTIFHPMMLSRSTPSNVSDGTDPTQLSESVSSLEPMSKKRMLQSHDEAEKAEKVEMVEKM